MSLQDRPSLAFRRMRQRVGAQQPAPKGRDNSPGMPSGGGAEIGGVRTSRAGARGPRSSSPAGNPSPPRRGQAASAAVLDVLGDGEHAEMLADREKRAGQRLVCRGLAWMPFTEAPVDLQDIEVEVAQMAERRVARPEIVHRETYPEALELGHEAADLRGRQDRAFGISMISRRPRRGRADALVEEPSAQPGVADRTADMFTRQPERRLLASARQTAIEAMQSIAGRFAGLDLR